MKVQINLNVASKGGEVNSFDLNVNAQDTVLSAKAKIAAAQLIAFPEQDLILDGEVLKDDQKLTDCGVGNGTRLNFVVKASAASLATQLVELLKPRDLSVTELGLLYCYKYGANINQALKTIGYTAKVQDFLKEQKGFLVENGMVALARGATPPPGLATKQAPPPGLATKRAQTPPQSKPSKPFSAQEELAQLLETAGGTMDLLGLCSQFKRKFKVSLASIGGMQPADFLQQEGFIVTYDGDVSLRPSTPPPPPPGLAASAPVAQQVPVEVDSQEYLELHAKISSRSFNSKVSMALNEFAEVVRQQLFLNVEQVVKGGSVGKGTAILGGADAELVLFLAAMNPATVEKWLPALLKAAAAVLREHLGEQHDLVKDIRVTPDSVRLACKEGLTVNLRFSPVFASHKDVVEAMRGQSADVRQLLSAAFAKERTQFISKQPGQVKVTMRLLKWWRDQQQWSSELSQPSDELLELMAVYSAVQSKPADQRVAIANIMSLFSNFGELRMMWSNFYEKEDVWSPLLRHRPLLMDPSNPFANVADPEVFDHAELSAKAQTTRFFW